MSQLVQCVAPTPFQRDEVGEGKVTCEQTWEMLSSENSQCLWLIVPVKPRVSSLSVMLPFLWFMALLAVASSENPNWASTVGNQSKAGWVDLAIHSIRVLRQSSFFWSVAKNHRLCSVQSGRKGMFTRGNDLWQGKKVPSASWVGSRGKSEGHL